MKWYSIVFIVLACVTFSAIVTSIGYWLVYEFSHLEFRYRHVIARDIQAGMRAEDVEKYFRNNSMPFEYESVEESKNTGYDDVVPEQEERFSNPVKGRYSAKFLDVGSGCVAPLGVRVYVFIDQSNRVCGTRSSGYYDRL